MKFVMDACSAILLAKAGVLEKALERYDTEITKQAYEEVIAGKKEMFADALMIERLSKEGKLKFASDEEKAREKLEKDFNMGKGEAATISVAITNKKGVITDNRQGRKAATINNLPLIGSIEIVVDLYKRRAINSLKASEALKTLREEGWFEGYLIEKAMEDIQNERI